MRSVTAKQITGPALGGASGKLIEMAWKYAKILGTDSIPPIVVRNNLSSRWLGRCHLKFRTTAPGVHEKVHLIEIQKSAMHDDRTLERVVAHEMAHYADHLGIEQKELALLKIGIKPDSHGPRWHAFADRINRVMGKDYVTVTSDSSHVLAPETKPFIMMIGKMPTGRLGFTVAVRVTPRMKKMMWEHGIAWEARLIESRDPRWASGPRIGGYKHATPRDPLDYQKLEALYEKATPIFEKKRP